MSSFVGLSTNNNNAAIVHALLLNVSQANFNRPFFTATYRTNWSITYIPGPSSSLLTSTNNLSPNDDYYPVWLLILIAIFGSVTSVLTVLGNILVILAFFLDRQIRQPTNYFILSLSVSDFLIGLLSMPLLTTYIYAKDWPLNAIICDIWLSLDYTVCLTSIYTVLFITIDRFCSVKMPAKYRKWRTKKRINIMIAVTWAFPTLIFFTSTMLYPRVRGISNLQSGVCDVQWNKNQIFNLCLTIGYFWTTLLVMIVLYIFIYGVASNLEKKSQENARKMSSLVGMAGNAMTQIGVGIGVKNSPAKRTPVKENHKSELTQTLSNESQPNIQRKKFVKQFSNNSSDLRQTNDGGDDEVSNSYESHSDLEANNMNEKKFHLSNDKLSHHNRRGLSVNWGSSSTTAINSSSTRNSPVHEQQLNQKYSSNVKSFAHSFYRSPIRLGGMKNKLSTNSPQPSMNLTPIPSESELVPGRMYPPPQPRPESLAIMSDELFHERLKARQSPLLSTNEPSQQTSLTITNCLSISSLNLDKTSIEDMTHSNQTLTDEHIIEINPSSSSPVSQLKITIEPIVNNNNNTDESSDESWRLLNSNSSLDIPYIDETDFEDLGYILHRRCIPSKDSNEPIQGETIVYKSPLYLNPKYRSKSSTSSVHNNNHDNSQDVHIETYPCINSNPSSRKLPIRHCSLRHVPRESLLNREMQSASLPISSNDIYSTTSAIFVSYTKNSLSQPPTPLNLSPSNHQNSDVERALIEFYQCSQINDIDDNLTTSESDVLSNYKEMNHDTPSLLRLNEQYSSAFTDDEYSYQCDNSFMKLMILNKTNLDTTSDDQTLTNSISLNTYSQDCSIDKIFQPSNLIEEFSRDSWISPATSSSSSSSSSSQDIQIPQHFLSAIDKKRNTSSDSDAITTTTTTLTTSTIFGGIDKRKISEELQTSELSPILKKHHSDTYINEIDSSLSNNRNASKVTFESFVTQTSVSSSPKTKDQCVMAQIDIKEHLDNSIRISEQIEPNKNGQIFSVHETTGTGTVSSNSTKSSVRELLQSQKTTTRRKSKTQNRARKALRTITFILGAFVVCWTPWHIYSAVHSLCESCKNNWVFSNPMFHCVYFLCYLNSPINPFCYALANQQFKKTFTRILKLDLRRL
ncbi:unnamed protein product [Adineta steineri]|uniref:G-protein coupled receptors family 1 profile domain-containing protein n=1 Tax=Adineta steineri TaxID=433720 RepID=A0A815CIA3_9BILA|nr:unnamed protein product [Adineta steineri]CAF3519982.1 unnamed protein product [Adineta steineri]